MVVEADDVRRDPRDTLTALCAAIELDFDAAMLSWAQGQHDADGVWAPHWYGAVHRSTGFEAAEGEVPELAPAYARLVEAGMESYERLMRHA